MKNITLKVAAVWLAYACIIIWFIYRIQGESVILFPTDVKYLFILNRRTLYAIIICLSILVLFCIYAVMNTKRFKWILGGGYGVLIILAVFVFSHDILDNSDYSWASYPIAHAMGAIDGYDYTNSIEAFEYNYSLGHRVFEVDFSVTSDGKMACMHDWDFGYQEGVDSEHIPSEETFKSIPIVGKYTPLTLKDLLLLMKEYEDIYIVTDTKSGSAKVAEHMEIIVETARETGTEDVLDRLIIQMYKPNMYEKIKNVYDFPLMILTLYKSGWDQTCEGFLPICRFCKNNNIRYITMWWYLATPEMLDIAESYGITVFVHTVNDLDMAEELIQSGVGGVYTDELVPSMFLD